MNLPVLFLSICKAEMGIEGAEVGLGSLYQKEPVFIYRKSLTLLLEHPRLIRGYVWGSHAFALSSG